MSRARPGPGRDRPFGRNTKHVSDVPRREKPRIALPWLLTWLLALGLSLPGAPARAQQAQSSPKVMEVPVIRRHTYWFKRYLKGHADDGGPAPEVRQFNARGDEDTVRRLLEEEILPARPAVVATAATLASRVARPILSEHGIPQVFYTVTDPVTFTRTDGLQLNLEIVS